MRGIQRPPCRQPPLIASCLCFSEHTNSDGGAKDAVTRRVELSQFCAERCEMMPTDSGTEKVRMEYCLRPGCDSADKNGVAVFLLHEWGGGGLLLGA